jgi:hypothetical protein
MKKLFIILCLLLLCFIPANAGIITVVNNSSMAVTGGGECSYTPIESNTSATAGDWDIKDTTGYEYIGQDYFQASAKDVCGCAFWLTYKAGDITSKNYYVVIHTISSISTGSEPLLTLVGTSDKVAGVNTWNDTKVVFTFSTPVTLSANQAYHFSLTHDAANDQTNYAEAEYSTDTLSSGYQRRHGADKAQTEIATSIDFKFEVYK